MKETEWQGRKERGGKVQLSFNLGRFSGREEKSVYFYFLNCVCSVTGLLVF